MQNYWFHDHNLTNRLVFPFLYVYLICSDFSDYLLNRIIHLKENRIRIAIENRRMGTDMKKKHPTILCIKNNKPNKLYISLYLFCRNVFYSFLFRSPQEVKEN